MGELAQAHLMDLDSVSDALLKHAGTVSKNAAVPENIAKEAAAVAKEVESGLAATAKLPTVPSKIAAEVKQAEEEISIENKVRGGAMSGWCLVACVRAWPGSSCARSIVAIAAVSASFS